MAGTKRTLVMEQGATFSLGFVMHHDGPEVDGEVTPGDPYDHAGAHMRMQVRTGPGGAVLLQVSDGDGITLGDGGRVDIVITDEAMDALTVRSGVYDLKYEHADGTEEWLLYGPVSNRLAVTRDADFAP